MYYRFKNKDELTTVFETTPLTWKLGFLCTAMGYLYYFIVLTIFNTIMWVTIKCEALGYHDYSFLLDDDVNQHTIVAVGIFEKFDYVTMKNYLREKTNVIHKCQSKLVKKFGMFWYQKMTEEEWKK